MTFHILGSSQSQLTNSMIFQRRWLKPPTNNVYQMYINYQIYTYIMLTWLNIQCISKCVLVFQQVYVACLNDGW